MRAAQFLAIIGRGSKGSNALELTEDRAGATSEQQDNVINTVNSLDPYGPSWQLVPGNVAAGTVYAQVPTSGTGDLTFTRASTATRTNSAGTIVNVATGVPRIDYRNANGSVSSTGRLLLEPQRTNSILRSNSFVTSPWFNSATLSGTSTTLTANSATAPDGTNTATLVAMTRPTTSGATYVSQIQSIAAGVYASSVYMRAKDATHVGKVISAWQWDGAERNLIDITLTNSWVRYSLLTTYSHTTGSRELLAFGFRNGRGSTTSVEFYAWGGQGELGAYATTYIPTTTAAVTRLADSASKTGVSDLIGQTEGTWFCEIDLTKLAGTVARDFIAIGDGRVPASSSGVYCSFSGIGSNLLRARVLQSGVVKYDQRHTITATGTYKIALGYKSQDCAMYVNGSFVGTVAQNDPFVISLNQIFTSFDSSVFQFGDGITQAALFKTRLTNAQLAEITTL